MNMAWLDKVWVAVNGKQQISRRQVTDVHRQVGEVPFLAAASLKGFHVAIVGPQYVVFRHPIAVKC